MHCDVVLAAQVMIAIQGQQTRRQPHDMLLGPAHVCTSDAMLKKGKGRRTRHVRRAWSAVWL